MATQAQRQPQPNGKAQTTDAPKSEYPITDSILDSEVRFKPFMSDDEITLTPRMIIKYFVRPTKSGKVCTMELAAKCCRMCQTRKLNPWEGDVFIVGFDGKDGPEFNIITAHQAFLKRAEVHPEYDGMESGASVIGPDGALTDIEGDLVPEGYQIVGGWARVFFKNRSKPMYKRLKLSTFNKNQSRWNTDPAGMIVKCAEADALRSSFPTSLGGMYLNEEFSAVDASAKRSTIPMPRSTTEPAANHVPQTSANNGHREPGEEPAENSSWDEPPVGDGNGSMFAETAQAN